MGMLIYFIILILFGVLQICETSLQVSKWRNVDGQKDIIMDKHVVQRFYDISKMQCAGHCDTISSCVSFFYNKSNKFCQLNDVDLMRTSGLSQLNITSSQGTNYYIKNKIPTASPLLASTSPMTTMLSSISQGTTTESCNGFVYDNSVKKYYTYISSFTGRVDDADPKCHQIGGRLATLKTQASIDAVKTIIITKASTFNETPDDIAFWLAASFVSPRRRFYWKDDDSAVSDQLWYTGQPEMIKGTANNTNCVVIIPYYGYTLDDFDCVKTDGTKVYPLCECP